jgi:hypothetical protein
MHVSSEDDVRELLTTLRFVCDALLAELDLQERQFASSDPSSARRARANADWLRREVRLARKSRDALPKLLKLPVRYETQRGAWMLADAVDWLTRHFEQHADDLDPDGEYPEPTPTERHPTLRRCAAVSQCVHLDYFELIQGAETVAERTRLLAQSASDDCIPSYVLGKDPTMRKWLVRIPDGERSKRIWNLLDDRQALERKISDSSWEGVTSPRALALAVVGIVRGKSLDTVRKAYDTQAKLR